MRTSVLRRLAVGALSLTATLCSFLSAVPAQANVPSVDPYQPYVAATNCTSSYYEKPGVVAFRDMTLDRLGGGDSGIVACTGYEHMEGRAWDWANNASNPADAIRVQKMLDWMFATDAAGNPHAMARRLGIAYVIWNRQVINMYAADKTWHAYTGSNPHTDHVHFAFSWAGALQQTTWFTTNPRPDDWYPDNVVEQMVSAAVSRPVVTAVYHGEYHVVSLAPTGNVLHNWWNGSVWGSENLGGTITGGLSVAVYRDRFYVVGSNNGQVWERWHANGSGFTPWTPIVNGTMPALMVYHDELHVVARGPQGNVLHSWWNGSWNTEDLGGYITSAPAAAVYRDRFYVVGSVNGQVWERWHANGSGFTQWTHIVNGTDPVLQVYHDELHVVARGPQGNVLHSWWNGSWNTENLGGAIIGLPAAVVYLDRFYVLGSNGANVSDRWHADGAGWTNWAQISTGTSPVVMVYNNEYHVVSRVTASTLRHVWWNGAWGSQYLPG